MVLRRRTLLPEGRYGMDDADFDAHVFVLSLRCVECNRRWDDPADRWRIYFTDDDPPESVTYCPDCARREFDD